MYRRRGEQQVLSSSSGSFGHSSSGEQQQHQQQQQQQLQQHQHQQQQQQQQQQPQGSVLGRLGNHGVVRVVPIVVMMAMIMVFLTMSNNRKHSSSVADDANYIANQAYKAERELENKVFHLLHTKDKEQGAKVIPMEDDDDEDNINGDTNNHDNIDPNGGDGDGTTINAATQAMLQQSSKWVDGEKKLKKQLKVLAERQKNGQDLGVPILTRFLGDDFPAFVPKGGDIDEWQRQVDEKYAEMREEEKEWQKQVRQFMQERGEIIEF